MNDVVTKSSAKWRGLAWCVLVVAFGMAIYRAGTQTIAHDEAHVQ